MVKLFRMASKNLLNKTITAPGPGQYEQKSLLVESPGISMATKTKVKLDTSLQGPGPG